ncbi:ATP-dependent helicase rhp16 (DNA repair protein rhp16) (RAD16 homolog) [Durusdinium trenchii]|uniref:ATP-dependent helicase rhp16 (DNA repair protein rhp16) (RAD16 homolog) n=1 Tax=Durusdinium trenchii TaxID=1381693 RepID=A0ABP0J129_9DINO
MVKLLTITEEGEWELADDDDQVYRARVERAKSGRAKCKFCGEMIKKDELRVAKPVKWAAWISSWRHTQCFYVEDGGGPISQDETYGFDDVFGAGSDEADNGKEKVLEALQRLKPPVVDESLNPENPNFAKAPEIVAKMPTPVLMTTALLPFQQEGLHWLLEQENGELGSGLLCDEMGMGKTIQTISLMVAAKAAGKSSGPTLVVAPSSAMLQWFDEVTNVTVADTLKVLVYHGNKRDSLTPGDILEHDIVLTSYPILEYEYRRCLDRIKVKCQYCGKKFLPRKLVLHNTYFCGPNSKRTAKLALRDRQEAAAKKKQAIDKAMATLDIDKGGARSKTKATSAPSSSSSSSSSTASSKRHSLPTPVNIYRDLMRDANRESVGMYVSKDEARVIQRKDREKPTEPRPDSPSTGIAPSPDVSSAVKNEGDDDNSSDFESPRAARPKARLNFWASSGGEVFCFKRKRDEWVSNLVSSDEAPLHFKQSKSSDKEIVLLQSVASQGQVLFKLDANGVAWQRSDNAQPWTRWKNGSWICSSSVPLTEQEENDGWLRKGPHTGSVVAREHHGELVVGAVVAYAPKEKSSPALWRMQHADGDAEDLERRELNDARSLCERWVNQEDGAPSVTLSKELLSAFAPREDVESNATRKTQAPKRKQRSKTKATKQKRGEKKKVKKNEPKAKQKSRTGDESDSSFSPGSSSSSDDDYEEDDDADEANVVSGGGKSKGSTGNAVSQAAAVTVDPSFHPARWGVGSVEARMMALYKLRKLKQQRGTKRKLAKKKRRQNGQAKRRKGGKEDPGAPPKKGKVSKGGKKSSVSDDSDFETSDDEMESASSSEEEEDEDDLEQELEDSRSRWEGKEFWFAAPGDVVDDDGVDLGISLLHCVGWHRIVLDEAHKIKDRVNSTAKATLALRGPPADPKASGKAAPDGGPCHRWCLSGTPLQNRVGDLYSLIRFLRMEPFAYYFCNVKDCDCKSLHWSFGNEARVCEQCKHPPMRHFSYFNKQIVNPIKRNGYVGEGRAAMKALRDDILGKCMLRRTKAERQNDINLPECSIEIRELDFSEHERDFYESVYKNTRSRFDTYVDKGTLLHNYAHIFELLSRLRRASDHPYLVVHGAGDDQFAAGSSSDPRRSHRTDVCGICHFGIETLEECAMSQCRHTFHKTCLKELYDDEDDDEEEEDIESSTQARKSKAKKATTKKTTTTKKKKKKKKKKNGKAEPPACPTCFVPLSVTLNLKGGTEGNQDGFVVGDAILEEDDSCVVCMENKRDALLLPCGHIYLCMGCAKNLDKRVCPMCREGITKLARVDPNTARQSASSSEKQQNGATSAAASSIWAGSKKSAALVGRKSILQRIDTRKFSSSSKVDAVVAEVKKMLSEERKDTDMPNKAIIFSQYNDMLDIVQWRLKSQGVDTVKLVGSLAMKERRAVLDAFKTKPEVRVILMSLKAGGEGLNLQIAGHVFLIDPWWNPAVEHQAIQRCHRIGQKRAVKAVRFVIKDSIEEKMMQLQSKKALIFEGAVDGNNGAMAKLTEEDLRFLFSR